MIPAAFAGWYLALLLAMLAYGIGTRLCPPELVVSGACTADWFGPFFDALVIGGACLAATLVVLFPALVAPAHRVGVARAALVAGVGAALWMALGDTSDKALLAPAALGACLCGAATLYRIERRHGAAREPAADGRSARR